MVLSNRNGYKHSPLCVSSGHTQGSRCISKPRCGINSGVEKMKTIVLRALQHHTFYSPIYIFGVGITGCVIPMWCGQIGEVRIDNGSGAARRSTCSDIQSGQRRNTRQIWRQNAQSGQIKQPAAWLSACTRVYVCVRDAPACRSVWPLLQCCCPRCWNEACRGHCPCMAAAHGTPRMTHTKKKIQRRRRDSPLDIWGEMVMRMMSDGMSIKMELTLMLWGVLNI